MAKRVEYHVNNVGTIVYTNENEKLHREDGPAVIWPNGDVFWWLNGRIYSFKEWIEVVNISDELKIELALRYG